MGADSQCDGEILIDGVKMIGCVQGISISAEAGSLTKVELRLVGVSIDVVADAEVRAKILDLTGDEG